jgi:putative FmdB family regulatory protein
MPIYSYKCKKCLGVYSEHRGINDNPKLNTCAICKVELVRLYEVRGVSFKGDGFYSNDKKVTLDLNL